ELFAATTLVLVIFALLDLNVGDIRSRLFHPEGQNLPEATKTTPTSISPTIKARRSVAVLGFKNLSGKPEEAWVSTALAEMLTTELGAGGQLRTIPGETVSRMKADLALPESDSLANDTLTKVYKVLGSDVIVLGSYLEIGGQIRVNFRVQDASGETIATESEQGTQSQFFDL